MPGLAPVAIQQGRCAAGNIARALAGKPYRQFKYVDKGALATVGRAFAILQTGRFKLSGLFAWLIWSLVHIAYLIGFRNRVIVMFDWAWAYVTYQRGGRLITGNIEELMAHRGVVDPTLKRLAPKAGHDGDSDAKPRGEIQTGRSGARQKTGRGDRIPIQGDAACNAIRSFASPHGKLKLREEESGAWMIFYGRQDSQHLKLSSYEIVSDR